MMKIIYIFCAVLLVNVSPVLAGDEQIKLLLAKPFLKADFTKIRQLKIMSRPFNTSGKMLFLPEKGLIWETLTPLHDILFISHDGVGQLDKGTNKLVKIDNPIVKSASTVFVTIISLDLDKIKQIFDINIAESVDGMQRYILFPKDENIKRAIKQIEIKGKKRVEKITILENGGDSTHVLFKNEQFNQDTFSQDELKLFEMM